MKLDYDLRSNFHHRRESRRGYWFWDIKTLDHAGKKIIIKNLLFLFYFLLQCKEMYFVTYCYTGCNLPFFLC